MYDAFTITRDEAKVVEANTGKQAKCRVWFHQRAGRVTASKFESAVCTDPMQPSVALIKSICYHTTSFKSAACEYGCKHEIDAHKEYEYVMKQHHQSFSVKESGSYVSICGSISRWYGHMHMLWHRSNRN